MIWAAKNRNLTQGGLNTKEMCAHEIKRWPVLGFSMVSVSETWKTQALSKLLFCYLQSSLQDTASSSWGHVLLCFCVVERKRPSPSTVGNAVFPSVSWAKLE